MPYIDTDSITPETRLGTSAQLQVYCALDSMITVEVREELGRLSNELPSIYSFSRAMQAPYLEIMQRGFAVDSVARVEAASALRARIEALNATLQQLALAAWGRGLNPRSPKQLAEFFFRAMRLPEVWLSQKGVRRISTNREALESLDKYLFARPFVGLILRIRELAKQLDVFEIEIDPSPSGGGRFRTSYNIAGTESGRPSSSQNAFGTGGNAQNIDPALRYPFIADPGWKLCVIDLEQVEARDVGFFIGCLFDDWKFLDNCESGDLHTNNCKLIWPDLGWTDNAKADRAIADQTFYREFSYRDMAKRGGHLSNYRGTAWTMARSLKIPIAVAEEFQARYCKGRIAAHGHDAIEPAFPGIPRWWQWTAQELQTTHQLETPFGRRRHFFGRPNDDTTLREGIAYLPQSTTADRMNLGMWRVWSAMPQIQLLAQTYDSITFQFRESANADEIIGQALALIEVELFGPNGRRYVVPGEAKIGWNWGYAASGNPLGLAKWTRGQPDPRARPSSLARLMK